MIRQNNGFIVLTSVIIMSVILIIVGQALSTSGYFQRRGVLDTEFKEQSYFLALSCADRALFKMSNDLDYVGNETLHIKTYQCTIDPITTQGGTTTIHTKATVDRSTTKLKLTTDEYLNLISFGEE